MKNTQKVRGKVEIVCKTCGKTKEIRKSRKTENNYCTLECYRQSLIGKINYQMRGKRHPSWKGDEASYSSIHDWVRDKKGNAGTHKCAHCDKQAKDWANIDHTYKRDLDDYVSLCRKCHIKFDTENNNYRCGRKPKNRLGDSEQSPH